jgi:hypothetical protein
MFLSKSWPELCPERTTFAAAAFISKWIAPVVSLLTGSGASSALKSALYPIILDDRIIRSLCSHEHETAAKPSPQTLASSYTSAATKAATATGTEFMAETSLKPHK